MVGCLQVGKKFPIHFSLYSVHTGSVVTRVITSTRTFSATVSPTAQQTAHPRDRWTRRNAHAQPPPLSSLPQRSLPKERTLRSVRLVRHSLKKRSAWAQCIVWPFVWFFAFRQEGGPEAGHHHCHLPRCGRPPRHHRRLLCPQVREGSGPGRVPSSPGGLLSWHQVSKGSQKVRGCRPRTSPILTMRTSVLTSGERGGVRRWEGAGPGLVPSSPGGLLSWILGERGEWEGERVQAQDWPHPHQEDFCPDIRWARGVRRWEGAGPGLVPSSPGGLLSWYQVSKVESEGEMVKAQDCPVLTRRTSVLTSGNNNGGVLLSSKHYIQKMTKVFQQFCQLTACISKGDVKT